MVSHPRKFKININITYLPPLSELFEKQSEVFEVKAGTLLSELIEKLFYNYREALKAHQINRLSPYIVIKLNNKVLPNKELNIRLKDNDFITLWVPVAGG